MSQERIRRTELIGRVLFIGAVALAALAVGLELAAEHTSWAAIGSVTGVAVAYAAIYYILTTRQRQQHRQHRPRRAPHHHERS